VLYLKFAAAGRTNLGIPDVRNMNLLIHHWFGARSQNPVNSFSHCSIKQRDFEKKDFAGELLVPYYLIRQGVVRPV
jgi:hypothetical protein